MANANNDDRDDSEGTTDVMLTIVPPTATIRENFGRMTTTDDSTKRYQMRPGRRVYFADRFQDGYS